MNTTINMDAEAMDAEAIASLRHFLSAAMIFPSTPGLEPVTPQQQAHGDAIHERTLDAFDEWFSLQEGNATRQPAQPLELSDAEIDAAWRSVDYTQPYHDFRIAVARAVLKKAGEK